MNLKIEDLEKNDNSKVKLPGNRDSPQSTARKFCNLNYKSK